MGSEKKRRVTIGIIISLSAVACLLIVGILFTIRWSEKYPVKHALAEANELILLGETESALGMLESVIDGGPNPRSVREYLRLHLSIAERERDYTHLLEASEMVTRTFGDLESYWCYRVLAESRSALHTAAVKHAEEFLGKKKYRAVAAEAYIAAGVSPPRGVVPEKYEDLLSLSREYRSAPLLKAWETYKHPGLLMEAVVLTAAKDGTVQGYELVEPSLKEYCPEGVLLLAYDAGRFAEALDMLEGMSVQGRGELLLLKGDIYLLNGYPRSAEAVYRGLLELTPAYSDLPYHNLSRLIGNGAGALQTLSKGLLLFPGSNLLQVSMITLLLEEGKEFRARELISEYLEIHPGDGYTGFLYDYLAGESSVPELHASRLWWRSEADTAPSDASLSYTAWYFGASGKYDDLRLFLNRTGGDLGNTPWHMTCRGIVKAMDGQMRDAVELFTVAFDMDERAENLYNTAVVHRELGDRKACMYFLAKAAMEAENGGCSEKHGAVIETELAVELADTGNRSGAIDHIKRALEYDPGYLEAKHLEHVMMKGK